MNTTQIMKKISRQIIICTDNTTPQHVFLTTLLLSKNSVLKHHLASLQLNVGLKGKRGGQHSVHFRGSALPVFYTGQGVSWHPRTDSPAGPTHVWHSKAVSRIYCDRP